MLEDLIDFFSLTTDGDAPLGLNSLKQENKLNQPNIYECKQYNFIPLFKQPQTATLDYDCGLRWLISVNH